MLAFFGGNVRIEDAVSLCRKSNLTNGEEKVLLSKKGERLFFFLCFSVFRLDERRALKKFDMKRKIFTLAFIKWEGN